MAKPYSITITNGVGQANVLEDSYSVTSNTPGYLDSSIDPKTLDITGSASEYSLKISGEASLTLHVTDTGTSTGVPIVGAKFIRCDRLGNTYGSEVTTDSTGNAVFQNLPYAQENAPDVFYKQTTGDGTHTFDSTLKSIILDSVTNTKEVENPLPPLKTFKLEDANYTGLMIESGTIILN